MTCRDTYCAMTYRYDLDLQWLFLPVRRMLNGTSETLLGCRVRVQESVEYASASWGMRQRGRRAGGGAPLPLALLCGHLLHSACLHVAHRCPLCKHDIETRRVSMLWRRRGGSVQLKSGHGEHERTFLFVMSPNARRLAMSPKGLRVLLGPSASPASFAPNTLT